jgi:enoyl-[acyl-carrier-protein] reductase (NADH)
MGSQWTNVLPRPLTLHDVADDAALLASDRAGAMTATITNISNGAIVD